MELQGAGRSSYCTHDWTDGVCHGLQSSKRFEKERTRLLCLAKMPFDDSDIMHLRLLQSVYLTYISEAGPVGRYTYPTSASRFDNFNDSNPWLSTPLEWSCQSQMLQVKPEDCRS